MEGFDLIFNCVCSRKVIEVHGREGQRVCVVLLCLCVLVGGFRLIFHCVYYAM